MTLTGTTRWTSATIICLDLVGELSVPGAATIQTMICQALVDGLPDELIVDLDQVTFLDGDGHQALVAGYVLAGEYGTRYRVVNAYGQVRARMRATETFEVLADSRDLGALMAAVLIAGETGVA